jgi:23S rRNA pseudouridine1911/1915/1917 synthase
MTLNSGCVYRHRVTPRGAGTPIAEYLSATFTHSDVATWTVRIGNGEVDVDGRRANRGDTVRAAQVITWRRPPWDEPEVPGGWARVFEDQWLLAVDKPSGLPTLPAGGFLEHTLWTLVRREHPDASPLHRLGRYTSGLVLFARDREAAARLSRAWREHRVEKRYRAVVSGVPSWATRSVDAPIGPVPHPRLGTVHAATPAGRAARSLVTVVERRSRQALVDVDIVTGRPHQVRIHLAWLGHPLAGDPLYGAGGLPRADDPGLPGDGGYLLHALRLAFEHPVTGNAMVLECSPPADLWGQIAN